jgi:DNA-binding transcriptional regulator GbsR (MarR family)
VTNARERDDRAVLQFIERFASVFAEGGVPRMPARVFVALLATDSGRLTAAELADLLQVSPAAISGAVRYLTGVNLIGREREPGSRRDYYRVYDDVWYEAVFRQDTMLTRWESTLDEGVSVLGRETQAGHRLAETRAFFEFFHNEVPDLMDRWRKYRDEQFGQG